MARRRAMAIGLCLTLLFAWAPARATTVTYNLDVVFSPPTGSVAPLASVTLTDLGQAVRFDVLNQAGAGAKLDSFYFNFAHGAVNPNQLVFSNVSAAPYTYSTLLAPSTGATLSGLKADGDGYYDGKFHYAGSNFLGHGQTLSFQLSAAGHDLDVGNFHFFSLPGGGTGTYIMASHLQNLSPGGTSAWVGTVAAVPLPGAVWLFGSGLAGLIGFARTKRASLQ